MSRIGKIPITIPKGVTASVSDGTVLVEGPKGTLSLRVPFGIVVASKENQLVVTREQDTKQSRANHGTIRALLDTMVVGVTKGHRRELEIQGVGFKAQAQDKKLVLNVGFSHPVEFPVPEGVKVVMQGANVIIIEGVDNALVGQVAANIRDIKPPEPYKGKGIRYVGEYVRRKQGKSVTK